MQDGIRQGYWTLYQAAAKGRTINKEDLPMMGAPSHIRHCIDLLRQSLMCYADTTVETREPGLNGVKGFGTEHVCKDWDELYKMFSIWQENCSWPSVL